MRPYLPIIGGVLWILGCTAQAADTAAYRDNGARATGYRDTDQDGILDFRDRCPRTPASHQVDVHGCAAGPTAGGVIPQTPACHAGRLPPALLTPAFAVGSAELTDAIRRTLGSVMAQLPQPPQNIELTGFADPRGAADSNDTLALQRALAVRRYLAAAGWDARRIAVRGGGEVSSATEQAGKTGREVRIHLSFDDCDPGQRSGWRLAQTAQGFRGALPDAWAVPDSGRNRWEGI